MELAVELVLLMLVIGVIMALGRYFGGLAALDLMVEQLQREWDQLGAVIQVAPLRADHALNFSHRKPEQGVLGIANDQIVFRFAKRQYIIPFSTIRQVSLRDVEYRNMQGDVIRIKDVVAIHQDNPPDAAEMVEHTFWIKEGSRPFAESAARLCGVELRQEPPFRSL
ncbi:MAG: hypothetical protein HY866_23270 [Chloroflexi bacterium]|nr:hypothetical protein [Chloroflexota bacterium]